MLEIELENLIIKEFAIHKFCLVEKFYLSRT